MNLEKEIPEPIVDQTTRDEWIEKYKEFLQEIKALPDQFKYVDGRGPDAKSSLEFIAKFIQVVEIQEFIRNDDVLAVKLIKFLTDTATFVIKKARAQVIKKKSTEDMEIRDQMTAACGSVTNFLSVNFSTIPTENYKGLFEFLSEFWYDGQFDAFGDLIYGPLVNLTRGPEKASFFIDSGIIKVKDLVLRSTALNPSSPQFSAIMESVENLSQVREARLELLTSVDDNVLAENIIIRIKSIYPKRVRIAVSGVIKNLGFDLESHEIFTNTNLDFLSLALLPIVGQGKYDEEELNEIPTLIYGLLIEDTVAERDPEPEVRHNIIEFLFRLCSTRKTRESLRVQNVYCLLREYHKWEPNEDLLELTERVVNLLIQTEEEIGADDLGQLKVEES